MNKLIIGVFLMALISSNILAKETKSTAVTIYNNGNGVINEIREIELKKGISTYSITDLAELLNPATVKISLKNATILEQNFKYDLVNSQKILNKYIGKEITLIGKNTINGILLSAAYNNIVIQKQDGGLTIVTNLNDYQISVGNLPDSFVLVPTLEWKIKSNKDEKQEYDLIYQTAGLSWKAEYVALINENDTKLNLNSWISLNNISGKTYKDAKLKLIAGDINRVSSDPQHNMAYARDEYAYAKMASPEMAKEKSFFEYHLYIVENPTTIANNESKQVAMFDIKDIICKKVFKYNSYQYVDEESKNPSVEIEFINSKTNNLGIPLPMGVVRVFKTDGTDKELIGESSIKHIARDETISLTVGNAFDITIKENLIKENRINKRTIETEYEIEIRNRKEEDINLIFQKNAYGNIELIKSDIDAFEKKANFLKFNIPVKKDEVKIFKYKIRISF